MNEPIRILIAEDLPTDAELAQREIRKTLPSCVFAQVETREDYLAALESFQPDLIVSDYHMPRFDGMTALKLALERVPLTPLIIWTGSLNEDIAVDCMKAGASNYVIKEHMKRLGTAVVHALEEKQVRLERQRAERALRESEERFRGLYENATIGIYRTTPNGRILMANPAAVRLLGYDSFEEISQRNLEEGGFEPSYSRKGFRDQIEKDEVISGLESAWVKKDGSIVFVRESARAIRDENGKTLYYDGTFEDITERKVAEQSLLESEARYRARTEELEALFTLSTRLREAQTADDMLPVILGEMRRVLDTDACEIRLLDATGERLLVALSEGASAARTGTTFGRDVGIAGHVMRTRQPYVTNDGSSQNSGVGG